MIIPTQNHHHAPSNQYCSISPNSSTVVSAFFSLLQLLLMLMLYGFIVGFIIMLTSGAFFATALIVPILIAYVGGFLISARASSVALLNQTETHDSAERKLVHVKAENGRVWDNAHCYHTSSSTDSDGNSSTTTHTLHIVKDYFEFASSVDSSTSFSADFRNFKLVTVNFDHKLVFADSLTSDAIRIHQQNFRSAHARCDSNRTFTSGMEFDNAPHRTIVVADPAYSLEALKFWLILTRVLGVSFFFNLWFLSQAHTETVTIVKVISVQSAASAGGMVQTYYPAEMVYTKQPTAPVMAVAEAVQVVEGTVVDAHYSPNKYAVVANAEENV